MKPMSNELLDECVEEVISVILELRAGEQVVLLPFKLRKGEVEPRVEESNGSGSSVLLLFSFLLCL